MHPSFLDNGRQEGAAAIGVVAVPPPLAIRLFGAFELRVCGGAPIRACSRRAHWLLAVLVLRREAPLSRARLAEELWPDAATPERALFYLRRSLLSLRQMLGVESWRIESPSATTLRLNLSGCFCDVVEFDAAAAAATSANDLSSLQRAASLYRAELLESWDETWVVPERTRRAAGLVDVLEWLADLKTRAGDFREAARLLHDAIELDPLREANHCRLMELLARSGDPAGVERQFQSLRRVLREELNVVPSADSLEVYRRARSGSGQYSLVFPGRESSLPSPLPPPQPQQQAAIHRLPCPLSALVGREQEIREVAEATDTHRIVTLTGVGGVGKTRLAIAVAEARTQVYVEGVVFVDLEPVRSPDLLIDSVAHAMELTINSQQQASSEAIYEALALQRMLLLLDNCEHLVERCRALVQSVLGRCPFVHVLCTSRQPLEITGEHIVTVPPLAVPPEPAEYSDKQQSNPEELLGYGAVALLAERASVGAERFQVTARNAAAVARICRRLDGLPLALELAATHLRHETPAAIAAQMDDRFHPLLRSRKHPLPRHRTLESVIGWSYEGLADNQRRQLNRLSVFRGPFGVSAVESVCGSSSNGAAGTLSGSDTTLLLEFLAARSLVMCEGKGDVARYHLLGSIREFAWDRLHESGEAQRVRSRHRDYFVDFAEHARTFFDGPQQAFWYAQLEREHDNLRAALEWCAAGDEEGAKTGLRLAAALWEFWNVRGYGREGLKLLQEILTWEGAKAPTEQRANALNGAGVLSVIRHDFMAAHRFLEESLHIWRDLGSAQIVHTLQSLGFLASEEGNLAVAKGLYEEALRLARSDGNRRFTLYPLQGLADVAHRQGDLLTARACYEESIAIAREFGDQGGLVWALNGLADVSSQLGDADAALAMQEEKSAIARQLQAPGVLIDALVQLGYQALIQGQYARARSLYEQRLEAAKDAQAIQQIGWGYYDLGVLAAYQSDYGRAHDLFQETLLLFGQAGLAKEEEFALPWAQAQITWYASWQKGHDRNAELRSVLEKTLTLFQTVDSTLAIPWVKCYLAWVVQDEGDCSLAGALLREALSSRSGFRDQERLIWCLFGLGRNLRARGQIAQTVRLLGALESALERIGFVLPQAIQEEREKLIADVRALVGSAEAPSLWSEGKAMTQEEAITYALKEAA